MSGISGVKTDTEAWQTCLGYSLAIVILLLIVYVVNMAWNVWVAPSFGLPQMPYWVTLTLMSAVRLMFSG